MSGTPIKVGSHDVIAADAKSDREAGCWRSGLVAVEVAFTFLYFPNAQRNRF
jgi:hypothetical protein